MQYFIGLRSFQPAPIFTPEVFVSIRKRLGEEGISKINEVILRHCQGERFLTHRKRRVTKEEKLADGVFEDYDRKVEELKKQDKGSKHTNRGVLMVDATVAPQDITHPMDTKLLNTGRLILEEIIDIYHADRLFGKEKPRTYRVEAKQKYLNFAKKKSPSKKAIKECKKQQTQYIRRDFRYIDELIDAWEGDGMPALPTEMYIKLLVVREMYRQQKEMYEDGRRSIEDRIVNIAQPYVRPIVRGKAGKKVEFGSKLNVSTTEGYLKMDRVDFNNFNESTGLIEQINAYKELYGYYPESVLADKIYLTRKNRRFLKKHEIQHYGPKLGRPAKRSKEEKRKRKKKQNKRSRIEGQFGLGKRNYGLDNIKMRRIDTSKCQIGLIVLSMNVLRMLQDVFMPIFKLTEWYINVFKNIVSHIIDLYYQNQQIEQEIAIEL